MNYKIRRIYAMVKNALIYLSEDFFAHTKGSGGFINKCHKNCLANFYTNEKTYSVSVDVSQE
jgi:hypothetical protein